MVKNSIKLIFVVLMGVILNSCLMMAGWSNVTILFLTTVICSVLYDLVHNKLKRIVKSIQQGPNIDKNNKMEVLKGLIAQNELLSHVSDNYIESLDNLIISIVMSASLFIGFGMKNTLLCTVPLAWFIFSFLSEINLLSEINEHREVMNTDNLTIVIRDPEGNPLDEKKTEELLEHLNMFIKKANEDNDNNLFIIKDEDNDEDSE